MLYKSQLYLNVLARIQNRFYGNKLTRSCTVDPRHGHVIKRCVIVDVVKCSVILALLEGVSSVGALQQPAADV